jgi:competence protein ComGC
METKIDTAEIKPTNIVAITTTFGLVNILFVLLVISLGLNLWYQSAGTLKLQSSLLRYE